MRKLLMFTSPTCGPCKIVKPTVDRLVTENNYDVETIDTWAQPEVAETYNVMATPTWVLELDGQEIKRAVGAMNRPSLIRFYND